MQSRSVQKMSFTGLYYGFALVLLICHVTVCARRDPIIDALKEKITASEISLSSDIKFLRDDIRHMSEKLELALSTRNGNGSFVSNVDNKPEVDESDMKDAVTDIEQLSKRIKRAFSEEKSEIKRLMAELKAEIGTFGKELGNLHQEIKENQVEAKTDLEKKLEEIKVKTETDLEKIIDEMKDAVITNLTAFLNGVLVQDLKPTLTNSLEAMSKDVSMVTDQCVSGIQSLTQKHDVDALNVNSSLKEMSQDLSKLSINVNENSANIVGELTELTKKTSDTLEAVADMLQFIKDTLVKVRIVNITETPSTIGGRLEVYYSDSWGTVCDDAFDANDAKVACVSLGFPSASGFRTNAFFGSGVNEILMDDVDCTGVETTLFGCERRGAGKPGDDDCNHGEDVGVICNK